MPGTCGGRGYPIRVIAVVAVILFSSLYLALEALDVDLPTMLEWFPSEEEDEASDASSSSPPAFGSAHLVETAEHPNPTRTANRTALCIVGQARRFELTGPSLVEHLFPAYNDSDVFLNVGLDHASHKLALLAGTPNLARVRVFAQTPLSEDGPPKSVLIPIHSPAGIQGLLQYFNLVEGCVALIQSHEQRHGFEYQWIVRTRLDTFWNARPPALATLSPHTYSVPEGSSFWGLNDRFGVGGRESSWVALRRLHMLAELQQHGYHSLNSEMAFAAQLAVRNIAVIRVSLPFCVVTERSYVWPVTRTRVPVASFGSKGRLNGAKCRPCRPELVGSAAEAKLSQLNATHHPGAKSGFDFCNASGPWPQDWEAIYDELVSEEWVRVRKSFSNRSFSECVRLYSELQQSDVYEGPPAPAVCLLAQWGPFASLAASSKGKDKDDKRPVYLTPVTEKSVVYSFPTPSEDLWWEKKLRQLTGCQVHVVQTRGLILEKLRGQVSSRGLALPKSQSFTVTKIDSRGLRCGRQFDSVGGLRNIMQHMGHQQLDLLRVVLDRPLFRALLEDWRQLAEVIPVCQLLIGFRGQSWKEENLASSSRVGQLRRLGFVLIRCIGKYRREKCLFVNPDACSGSSEV